MRVLGIDPGFAITGYSMGGFGAFNAVMSYPETFGIVGSMSGAVDIEKYHTKWNIEKIFGEEADWGKIAVKNNLYKILDKKVNIIFGCGTGDDFITINRELHEKMIILDIPHTYIERPGKHDWDYWRTELEFQLLYFSKYLSDIYSSSSLFLRCFRALSSLEVTADRLIFCIFAISAVE